MDKIVFSDVDGTLLNSEHKITSLTEKAIKELKKKDIPFVIISARSPSGIYPILKEYAFKCPIVSYSGALILDEEKLKEAFPNYSIVKSSDILLEIMENGISKADAVHTLCSLWDIRLENAIAFGDNYNDVEMLEAVGYGFLMGNAPDDLKQRIQTHTYDNNNDGIYHALLKMNMI